MSSIDFSGKNPIVTNQRINQLQEQFNDLPVTLGYQWVTSLKIM